MERLSYLNFELLVERWEPGYRLKVLNSPAGQASSTSVRLFSDLKIENFLLNVGRKRGYGRSPEPLRLDTARIFGRQLFETIFPTEVRECLRSSLEVASRQGMGLRIQLRMSETPELATLPWEFLYDPTLQQFFVLSTHTPLVRYLDLPQRIQPLKVDLPLNILVMISHPRDYPALDVDQEWDKLKGALVDLEQGGQLRLDRLETATLNDLQRQLRKEDYHIFHYIGHGGFDRKDQDGVLVLEDESESGHPISGRELGIILHDARSLRLAVLNSCEGARTSLEDPFSGVANSLVKAGVPAVVAMQFEITDQAAITFADDFYTAVADGYPVDAAVAEARKAIYGKGREAGLEWGTPVLYLRSPDAQIFEIIPQYLAVSSHPDLPVLSFEPAQLTVHPGEQVAATLTICNPGTMHCKINLEVNGVPGEWLSGLLPQVELAPGERQEIALKILPPRRPDTLPGRYQLKLKATQASEPGQAVETILGLDVTAFRDYACWIQPQFLFNGRKAEVLLENRSNISQSFNLIYEDPSNVLTFEPDLHQIQIKEGACGKATVRVTSRQRAWFGDERRQPFQVMVSASGMESQTLTGEVRIKARLPKKSLLIMSAVPVLFFILLLSGVFTQPPALSWVSFQPEEPLAGQPVIIYWTASRTSSIDLTPLVLDLDPDLGKYRFQEGFAAPVTITVTAWNSFGESVQILSIPVVTEVNVPNLVGQTDNNARQELESHGLIYGGIIQEQSETISEGSVIRSEPPAGAVVKPGSEVTLVLSEGPLMPDLVVEITGIDRATIIKGSEPPTYVRYKVQNIGKASTPNEPIWILVYHDEEDEKALIGSYEVVNRSLQPGETVSGDFHVGYDDALNSGFYTIKIKVDSIPPADFWYDALYDDGEIEESLEDNNGSNSLRCRIVPPD